MVMEEIGSGTYLVQVDNNRKDGIILRVLNKKFLKAELNGLKLNRKK